MMRRIEHRGPDEGGLLVRRRAALGMRRLSIIDLGGGSQPVFNEDGAIGVVFNGEIYNFPDLRTELESRGHRFRTHSDTEVIVHAYEEWGERCPEHLRGMFAFALWDGRGASKDGQAGGRILLARDRFGIKPLYYAAAEGTLLFASEVRALLASGLIPRKVARESVEAYLLFGSVVEPMTLVEGVFSLPPGHSLLVACDSPLAAKPVPYWDLADSARKAAQNAPRDLDSAARAVRPMLEQAVRSHLMADVPLGIFLSSGLDSTALAALAARERSDLHTFTVAFTERDFSEATVARETAKRLGTEHRELIVTPDEMAARLPEAVTALDQPSMDGVNTFFVSWAARQVGLKVALSGLGGDEIFGGYNTFRNTPRIAKLAMLASKFPPAARGWMAETMVEWSRRGRKPKRSDVLRKIATVWGTPKSLPHPYFFTRMLFTPRQVALLSSPEVLARRRAGGSTRPWVTWLMQTVEQAERLNGDSAVSCLELRTYMLDTLLRDTDAMSMSHSLEVRVPLLDHSLVEYVVGLPDSAKRRGETPKALLAEALKDLLPAEILRQPKRTFTFPWERWLHGPLGLQVAIRLGSLTPSLAELLDASIVQSIWRSFLLERTGWARPWSLYVLNEWIRVNLDEVESLPETVRTKAAAPGVAVS
jgi:asparagine synthase (glutamine-hydrolysing)